MSQIASHFAAMVDVDECERRRTERIDLYCRRWSRVINDAKLSGVVVERVARAVVDGRIDPESIESIVASIRTGREAGRVRCSGAYFVTCCKRVFAKECVPW